MKMLKLTTTTVMEEAVSHPHFLNISIPAQALYCSTSANILKHYRAAATKDAIL